MSPGLRRLLGRRESGSIAEELEAGRRAVIAEHGEWLAHNVHVGEGVYTRSPALYGDEGKVLRAVQLIEDLVRKPWPELRIADLGANEGLYACEFALRGAAVVAVEGRESNLAKARFAKDSLGLDNLELVKADVRSLSREAHGGFDVVLCWGLLYHLDTPDVFDFVRPMREVCDGVAIVDTHISLSDAALAGVEREMFWADPDALGPMEARTHSGRELLGPLVARAPRGDDCRAAPPGRLGVARQPPELLVHPALAGEPAGRRGLCQRARGAGPAARLPARPRDAAGARLGRAGAAGRPARRGLAHRVARARAAAADPALTAR